MYVCMFVCMFVCICIQIYLARVRGFFPNRPPALQQLQKIELKNFEIDFDADLEPDAGSMYVCVLDSRSLPRTV